VEPEETVIARQWLGKHASVAKDMHATMEELLDVVFSMWSVPRLYNDKREKLVSHDSEVMSCETVASWQGHEHGSRGISIVGSCYLAVTRKDRDDFVFVVVTCRL
jgi:hypothetical protein